MIGLREGPRLSLVVPLAAIHEIFAKGCHLLFLHELIPTTLTW